MKVPHEYFEKIKAHFNGDDKKAWEWFKTTNPALGMFSPLDMIKLGRGQKLMKWIDARLQGYFP